MNLEDKVIEYVCKFEGISITELAKKLGYAKSTISEMTTKLEREGFLKKVREGGIVRLYTTSNVIKIGIIKASEYLIPISFLKKFLESLKLKISIQVFNNGIEVAKMLISNKLDLAFLPSPLAILTTLLSNNLRLYNFGITGGSFIIKSSNVKSNRKGYLASTKISTMEYCICKFVNEQNIEFREIIFSKSGDEILQYLTNGHVEYVALWEPYASYALKNSKLIIDCRNLGIECCCLLIGKTELEKLIQGYLNYLKSTDLNKLDPECIEHYSSITGINEKILSENVKVYDLVFNVRKFINNVLRDLTNLYSVKTLTQSILN